VRGDDGYAWLRRQEGHPPQLIRTAATCARNCCPSLIRRRLADRAGLHDYSWWPGHGMRASAALCAWMGAVSAWRCRGQAGACQGVGTAEGIGQPVPACHAPDPVRGLVAGHPGSRDIQRAGRAPA
jgi:hypothetical protein